MTIPTPNRHAARLVGLCFIASFLSYGIGSSLVDAAAQSPDFPGNIPTLANSIIAGGILIAIAHTVSNIAMPVIMWPILRHGSPRLAMAYLAMVIAATTILALGGTMLLGLPASTGATPDAAANVSATLLINANTAAYHVGMALWSIAGLFFCVALVRANLLPRFLPVWGFAGYLLLLAGSVWELFGPNSTVQLISVIPGGLFEVSLSLWLIIFGFSRKSPVSSERIVA